MTTSRIKQMDINQKSIDNLLIAIVTPIVTHDII